MCISGLRECQLESKFDFAFTIARRVLLQLDQGLFTQYSTFLIVFISYSQASLVQNSNFDYQNVPLLHLLVEAMDICLSFLLVNDLREYNILYPSGANSVSHASFKPLLKMAFLWFLFRHSVIRKAADDIAAAALYKARVGIRINFLVTIWSNWIIVICNSRL
jgi:hypothetical protein